MRTISTAAVVLGCLCLANGYYRLKPLHHLQLPTAFSHDAPLNQGLNKNAAIAAAYDSHFNILYVLGKDSHLLHVVVIADPTNATRHFIHQFDVTEGIPKYIVVWKDNHLLHVVDIADPTNPTRLFTHHFDVTEGIPKSIAVCDNEIAVGLRAQTAVHEGHIRFYNIYEKGSGKTDLELDGYITVGPSPDHIQYTSNCVALIIPNEGTPGKDEGNHYIDPEGTVAIMETEKTGNPTLKHVDFQEFDKGGVKYDANIRQPSMFVPTSVHSPATEFSQDVEPTYAAISSNMRTAWVTLPYNNAIASIDLNSGLVSAIKSLPLKDWSQNYIDTSDRDGGVHRRRYPGLKSLRQPTVIKSLEIGKKTYLFTADTGVVRSYTGAAHTFAWSDSVTARSLVNSIDNAELKVNASNDEFLGRLHVSQIDGKDARGMYTELVAFGGRGFSIWDSSDFSAPVFDSDGTLEEYMEASYKAVFNTDYYSGSAAYESPERMRDTVSDDMGAQVTAMDIKEDNGTTFLAVGTSQSGTLYLYTVNVSSGQPIPSYQSIYRSGVTDEPWNDLYQKKTAGDLYITDIGIIPSGRSPTDVPLVYVISKGSGAVSLYEIEYHTMNVGDGS